MKISYQWIKSLVDLDVSAEQLADQFTMGGQEVDSVSPAAPPFSGVVVGRITATAAHPNADRLQICSVDVGSPESLSIVCGANNARAKLAVAVAIVGAELPGSFIIKPAKLRDVESAGMLCSASELGLSEQIEGILELPDDAPIGLPLRDYLDLDDTVIDLELTPNRGDCFSALGLAREAAVLNERDFAGIEVAEVPAVHDEVLSVDLQASGRCPRYLARVMNGVDVSADTPIWILERLRRCGIRSVNPIVDVGNYVMLELGQPMHAFDKAKIDAGIIVRGAIAGESLRLLDGNDIRFDENVLLIADHNRPLAMAGIMGGADSAVSETTRDIVLESAFFSPSAILGRARDAGIHTDSSHRFERGVDPQLQRKAMHRATALIQEIAGGGPGPIVEIASDADLPKSPEVVFRPARCNGVMGAEVAPQRMLQILQGLDFEIDDRAAARWRIRPPSARFDIAIEEDIIEEVARVVGYDCIAAKLPGAAIAPRAESETRTPVSSLGACLQELGYYEVVTYSFLPEGFLDRYGIGKAAIPLANPLNAELAVMRTSLLPGLIQATRYNLRRQAENVRLFESGLCFFQAKEEPEQIEYLGGIMSGNRMPENWAAASESVDFFDLKAHLAQLFQRADRELDDLIEPSAEDMGWLHPGQSARICDPHVGSGWLGRLHPGLCQELDLPIASFAFEIPVSMVDRRKLPSFRPISRFPTMRRDLAVIVDEQTPSGNVLQCVRESSGKLLVDLKLFDVYRDARIGHNQKSLGLGLVLGDAQATLTDAACDDIIGVVRNALCEGFNATFRE